MQATQVDAPTPPVSSQETDLTGARERQFFPFATVEDPPDLGAELLSQPEADNEGLSPAKKRPSTQSPSPAAAIADHAYPPAFHGASGSQPSHSPLPVHVKRGRGALSPSRATTRVSAASPVANFIATNFPAQADSPLQDHSTSVKKAKASEEGADPGSAIPQDLADQFEGVQLLAFPQ